jgi:GLPGLI family protein
MNKRKISFFVIILFTTVTIKSQSIEGIITYVASSKQAISNLQKRETDKSKQKLRSRVNKLYEEAKDIEVILKFNNLISEYSAIKDMNISDEDEYNLTHIMAGGSYKYYTNNSIMKYNNYTLNCLLLGECFLIENPQLIWELSQESKNIGEFLCYKAVLKNPKTNKITVEAWYSPEIPYSYGVMNYYGLPGIILQITRKTISITAIKIELNPIEKVLIKQNMDIKKITRKEFDKLKKQSFSEFYKKN